MVKRFPQPHGTPRLGIHPNHSHCLLNTTKEGTAHHARWSPHALTNLPSWSFRVAFGGIFSAVQSLSCVRFFATPWTAARQAPLSITNSRSFLKLMSVELVMTSKHLILCRPLFLLPSIFWRNIRRRPPHRG